MIVLKVYIAGPIGQGDAVKQNVERGVATANELLDLGFYVFAPHLFTFLGKERDYEFWMEHCFQWLKECTALLRLPGASPGADREIEFAIKGGMKIFYSVESLVKWRDALAL